MTTDPTTPDRTTEPPEQPEGFFDALGISSPKRIVIFVGCVLAALALVLFVPAFDALEPAPRRALFILVLAALLWVSEAIAAFSVGILIIALNIALLGNPDREIFATTDRDWEQFVEVLGHPLVWLFFGGFVLAAGMARTGLDRWLASRLLSRLGTRPSRLLLGVMAVTFTLSMFMSNTATTAMIIAMLAPLLPRLDRRFATGLLVGTAVAANLGGMGSLIGTPPNAIAVGVLSERPGAPQITFLDWMMIGLPLGAGLAVLTWLLIVRLYPAERDRLPAIDWTAGEDEARAPTWQVIVVVVTLVLTIGLWMTAQWHGMPTAVVSFVPIVLFTTTGILGAPQIRGLNYDVLFLLAGGLALGQVVTVTGLSDWIVGHIPSEGLGVAGIAFVVSIVTLVLSNFMSNTAAANIIIPLTVTMAVGAEARVAVPVALSASAAMCLPIATPPNAMVFATGRCRTMDFLRMGLVLGLLTPALAVVWSSLVLRWMGG
jgi:sodium-dependent dicarboxylate transporter 2/3/5